MVWKEKIQGVNLEGICRKRYCPAESKKVIHQVGMKDHDFVQDRLKTVCPLCLGRFKADTCILVDCKFKFFKIKITPSSRLKVIEPSEYENVPQNKFIILDIQDEMKNYKWSQFKIIPASFSDYEEFSPNKKCMLCFQIISKNSRFWEYPKCGHILHKRCDKKLDNFDKYNCIMCDERDGFDSDLYSSTNSPEKYTRKNRKQKKKRRRY